MLSDFGDDGDNDNENVESDLVACQNTLAECKDIYFIMENMMMLIMIMSIRAATARTGTPRARDLKCMLSDFDHDGDNENNDNEY